MQIIKQVLQIALPILGVIAVLDFIALDAEIILDSARRKGRTLKCAAVLERFVRAMHFKPFALTMWLVAAIAVPLSIWKYEQAGINPLGFAMMYLLCSLAHKPKGLKGLLRAVRFVIYIISASMLVIIIYNIEVKGINMALQTLDCMLIFMGLNMTMALPLGFFSLGDD